MPRIPVVTGPQVESQPLPIPQLRAASPAAFGAELGQGLQQVGGLLSRAAEEERAKQDAARLTAVSVQVDELEHQLLFDPERGSLNRKGFDAIPTYDDTLRAYDTATAALEAGLANDQQKAAFAQMRAQRRRSIGNTLENHTKAEVARADAESVQAAVESAANLGITYYNDPARRAQELARGVALIQSYAKRSGLDAEATAARVASFASALHSGVVERALANQDTALAASYLAEYRDAIDGSKLARLEEAVQQGGILTDAFAAADRITATAPDRATALADVRKIANPEVRQRAQAEVNQFYSEREQAAREAENQLFDRWSDRLEQVHGINRLRAEMGTDWLRLDQNSRVALEQRAEQLARGTPPVTRWDRYTDFIMKSPAEMAKVNPMRDLRPYLDDGDYQRLAGMVAEARRGAGTGDPSAHLSATMTFRDQVTNAAAASGIVPLDETPAKWSTDEQRRFGLFERAASYQVEAFERLQGRKATTVERQQIIDQVTLQKVRLNEWGRDPDVPAAVLSEDERGNAYVPTEQIPADAIVMIENLTRSNRVSPSRKRTERAYAAYLMDDRARFNAIIAGQE